MTRDRVIYDENDNADLGSREIVLDRSGLTPKQPEYLQARDERPFVQPKEWRRRANIADQQVTLWLQRPEENGRFIEENGKLDHKKTLMIQERILSFMKQYSGKSLSDAAGYADISMADIEDFRANLLYRPFARALQDLLSERKLPAVTQADKAEAVLPAAPVAYAIIAPDVMEKGKQSFGDKFGEYLAALRENKGNYETAMQTSGIEWDEVMLMTHEYDLHGAIDKTAKAAGNNQDIVTYWTKTILRQSIDKKKQDGHSGDVGR
jgi:hypothetical protein